MKQYSYSDKTLQLKNTARLLALIMMELALNTKPNCRALKDSFLKCRLSLTLCVPPTKHQCSGKSVLTTKTTACCLECLKQPVFMLLLRSDALWSSRSSKGRSGLMLLWSHKTSQGGGQAELYWNCSDPAGLLQP